ncbi:hypothetical protein N9B55_01550 [Vicingaceae bacterium]|nr:hypothetical protein [Vicingaceae bacterium]
MDRELQRKYDIFFRAHSFFIIEMRSKFHTICLQKFGIDWEHEYSATFRTSEDIKLWNTRIQRGEKPENLIECSNLEMFADYYKESKFFLKLFPGIRFSVATYFRDIAKARNMTVHNLLYDKDIADTAYLNMITVSDKLEKKNLVIELRNLKNSSNIVEKENLVSESRNLEDSSNIVEKVNAKSNSRNNGERLYTNREIQIEITKKAQTLPDVELNKLCDKDFSKETFDNNYPIFVKVPQNASIKERQMAIKDHNNKNRWTFKYEFNRSNYSYFITTQWYPRNDIFVKNWLQNKT